MKLWFRGQFGWAHPFFQVRQSLASAWPDRIPMPTAPMAPSPCRLLGFGGVGGPGWGSPGWGPLGWGPPGAGGLGDGAGGLGDAAGPPPGGPGFPPSSSFGGAASPKLLRVKMASMVAFMFNAGDGLLCSTYHPLLAWPYLAGREGASGITRDGATDIKRTEGKIGCEINYEEEPA
ncbi:hypothetical protein UVI_02044690 [Ustilaginoidea virens]|uniref:Uncharacterized protein n=1 Tax=Ustilaginoidea virens TaxID=1159556 RepID=A0A1B5L1K0_USTVR|nr:hypothetical protein UVI_02044690 [Ustilaginoidea virens]